MIEETYNLLRWRMSKAKSILESRNYDFEYEQVNEALEYIDGSKDVECPILESKNYDLEYKQVDKALKDIDDSKDVIYPLSTWVNKGSL